MWPSSNKQNEYNIFLNGDVQADSKYFTVDESKETVSKHSKYNPSAQRE